MIKKFIYLFLFLSFSISGQQTINKLITKELTVQDKIEVTSTTKSSKPCPVMTEVQRDAISSPATGSCVYNSNSLQLNVYDGSTWQEAGGGGISLWATGLSYDVNDVVIESDRIYRCLITHTSGTFSTDLASGNWTEVSGSIPVSLQDVYEDSNQPQITTNTSGLGIQFKRGTLDDADVVVEVLNGAGTSKFSVTGEGAVSAGSTITAAGNITGANLAGTNTGNSTVDAASGYIGGAGMQVVEVPNAQVTSIDLANKKVRFEFGNNNELINANMEAQTVAEGWTISNATSSSSTTRIEGSKSLSLALTGALSLSQSSTINAAQKSGVQMVASIWVNSSDVSDLQLCSLKNGAEDKCTVTGGYVQGSGWRQLTVSFLGDSTSNGLKLKSTDTTGTVLVDQAYVGIGSPVVDFTPDMVYSAKLLQSSGAVSSENTDFISSCTSGVNPMVCTFVTNTFSVAPNCAAAPNYANVVVTAINAISATSVSIGFYSATTGASLTNGEGVIVCQKQGSDYKTSKAYVASGSLALNTTEYSALISSTGTVSTSNVSGWTTGSTFAGGEWTINFGSGYFPSVAPACVVTPSRNGSDAGVRIYNETTTSAKIAIYIAGAATQSAFHIVCQKQGADYQAAFNPVIVGSFQGYNETPGTSRPVVSSVQVAAGTKSTVCTTGSCTLYANRGGFVSAASWSSAGTYNITLNPAVSSISETNCVVSPISTSGGIRTCKFDSPIDSTSEIVRCTDNANSPENNLFTIMCHGSL